MRWSGLVTMRCVERHEGTGGGVRPASPCLLLPCIPSQAADYRSWKQDPQRGQVVHGYYITAYRNLTTVSLPPCPPTSPEKDFD